MFTEFGRSEAGEDERAADHGARHQLHGVLLFGCSWEEFEWKHTPYLEWKAPKWTSKLEFLGPVTSFERKIDVEKSKSGRVRSWPCEFGTFGCVLVIKARLTQLQVLRYHPGILS